MAPALSSRCFLLLNALVLLAAALVSSFQPVSVSRPALFTPTRSTTTRSTTTSSRTSSTTTVLHVFSTKEEKEKQQEQQQQQPPAATEETTEKFGLEAGLFQSLKRQDGGESAKSLLKKYGTAYLVTSIPLALVSFAICYLLVDNGVNVGGLLANIGIESSGAADKAGTFAIAYAAHKAASPIRFPPTVLLTPIVAKLIGKEVVADDEVVLVADDEKEE